MVGTGVLPLNLALFIILGANIGTCVTALLASFGANANSKRVAFIHFTFNTAGTVLFAALIWIFKEQTIDILYNLIPGSDPMALQMRVSVFHVIFNLTTTLILLPFVKQLVKLSKIVIKEKKEEKEILSLKYVDSRLLSAPHVALMQVKKEMDYMLGLVEENIGLSFVSIDKGSLEHDEKIRKNEEIIDFTNSALTKYLIDLSVGMGQDDERIIGSYFHVLNDLERIGDHAENFHEIGAEMIEKKLSFSDNAHNEIAGIRENMLKMFSIAKDAFENLNRENLPELTCLEESVDEKKDELIASHFARLAEGNCNVDVSPYFSSLILGLERVADHLVNIGYSIVNPTGSQKNS